MPMNPLQSYFKKHTILNSNLQIAIRSKLNKLFKKNSVNICYNKFIPEVYDPSKDNILLAIESPAVVEYENWIRPGMKFVAEISFANYMNLENYYCCRDLYVNADHFIDVKTGTIYNAKPKLASIISSSKKHLPGHKMRHEIIAAYRGILEVSGSGYGKFGDITPAYTDYMFQVVIENGKYPEYVSEKFFNCLKTQTIPIYWGGHEAVRKMGFDTEGIIFFDSADDLKHILNTLSPEFYHSKQKSIFTNLNRLIELRNEQKMNVYLNSVLLAYMQTTKSYLGYGYNKLNLAIEKIIKEKA